MDLFKIPLRLDVRWKVRIASNLQKDFGGPFSPFTSPQFWLAVASAAALSGLVIIHAFALKNVGTFSAKPTNPEPGTLRAILSKLKNLLILLPAQK